MFVIKRSGVKEQVYFDKITRRLNKIILETNIKTIDPITITQKICSSIYPGITTSELDILASNICMSMIVDNPDLGVLGSRLIISNHQKNTSNSLFDVVINLSNNKDVHNKLTPLVNPNVIETVTKYRNEIENMIDHSRDYLLDFFGFKTLERSYLLRVNDPTTKNGKKIVERPQHLFMRVAIGIHGDDLMNVKKTYDGLSLKRYTHGTPTLFNSGTNHQQNSSCYLLGTDDSVEGIFETMSDCAKISKWSGGIGLHISNIRSKGSYIRQTAGTSDGIIPMLKVYNDIARYINQCFTPDTIIYTKNGPKKISTVIEGDMVITNDGSFKDVIGIKKSSINKEILRVKTTHSIDFVNVTDEHEIYVVRGKDQLNSPEYISANELTLDDLLCFPIPKIKIKDEEDFDNDITRLYGIMLGVADMHADEYNDEYHDINIRTSNSSTVKFIQHTLTKYGVCYSVFTDVDANITAFRTNVFFNYNDIYYDNMKKHISIPFLHMTEENILHMIIGLIESNWEPQDCVSDAFYFCSTSQKLIESLRYCLLRIGILTSGRLEDSYYYLRIPKVESICSHFKIDASNNLDYFRHKDCLYSTITSIKRRDYNGEVYDLNIKDNHNYLTQMGLVHNSGKRNGSIAVYIEPHHADIFEFLEAKKNTGPEEIRARDLFYALWISDYFMQCVEKDTDWYLMDPDNCKGLNEVYSSEYVELYNRYVSENRYIRKIKARTLWEAIISSQIEHGMPYISYKDSANSKSNQQNIGVIKSSNLCNEIYQVSDSQNISVCNLASICLTNLVEFPNFKDEVQTDLWISLLTTDIEKEYVQKIKRGVIKIMTKPDCVYCRLLYNLLSQYGLAYKEIDKSEALVLHKQINSTKTISTFPQVFLEVDDNIEHIGGYVDMKELVKGQINYPKLEAYAYDLTINLNKIIDNNFYPTYKAEKTNFRDRPIGLGVQGLADVFMKLKIPFTSNNARVINKHIFETIYYGSMSASINLAMKYGPYDTYEGSPLSKGKFQFNLWNVEDSELSGMYNWSEMREKVMKFGSRNSLNLALMPTASTASIFGNTESFEVITSNLYTRNVLSGVFTIINKYLVNDLIAINMWNDEVKDRLIFDKGSVKNVPKLPSFLKDVYKTAFEIDQKLLIKMSAERGIFVCQSQSLNLFFDKPSFKELTSCHFYGWKQGLKTGSYYIRTKPAINPQNFGMSIETEQKLKKESNTEDEECVSCSA